MSNDVAQKVDQTLFSLNDFFSMEKSELQNTIFLLNLEDDNDPESLGS